MPCLNEAETVATCVRKPAGVIADNGVDVDGAVAGVARPLRRVRGDAAPLFRPGAGGVARPGELVARSPRPRHRRPAPPPARPRPGRRPPPHLNPWRDGWRRLRFLLLFSRGWL